MACLRAVSGRQAEGDGRDDFADQADEPGGLELELHVAVFLDDAFEPGVFLLDGFEGVVDQARGGAESVGGAIREGDGGIGRERNVFPDGLPAGERGHPEDVFLRVIIAVLELGVYGGGVGGVGVVVGAVEVVVVRRIAEGALELLAAEVEGV